MESKALRAIDPVTTCTERERCNLSSSSRSHKYSPVSIRELRLVLPLAAIWWRPVLSHVIVMTLCIVYSGARKNSSDRRSGCLWNDSAQEIIFQLVPHHFCHLLNTNTFDIVICFEHTVLSIYAAVSCITRQKCLSWWSPIRFTYVTSGWCTRSAWSGKTQVVAVLVNP